MYILEYMWVSVGLKDSSCVIHFLWASCRACGCWKIDGSTPTRLYLLHRQLTTGTISFNLPYMPTIISGEALHFYFVTSLTFSFKSIDFSLLWWCRGTWVQNYIFIRLPLERQTERTRFEQSQLNILLSCLANIEVNSEEQISEEMYTSHFMNTYSL